MKLLHRSKAMAENSTVRSAEAQTEQLGRAPERPASEEDLHDISSIVLIRDIQSDMLNWEDTDPPMQSASSQLRPANQLSEVDNSAFFQLPASIKDQAEVRQMMELMRQGLADISKLQDAGYDAMAEYQESDEAWTARLLSYAPDPEQFQAGRMHSCLPSLQEYFRLTGNRSANAKKVLSWVRKGIVLPFVGLDHRSHDSAPEYRKKLEVVKRMLAKAVGAEQVVAYLEGITPSRVQFPNHKSAQSHEAFVDAELAKAEAKGVIVEWPFAEPPKVVNGLKVVEGKKNRLCINPMYINVFMEYFPVKYEGVRDLVDIIQRGDFMSTSDDKSGYWQLPLHPDMWQYMGIAWKDRYMVWRMAAFGISVLPWIYSTVKQEIYRPLRLRGVRLGFLIDDR